MSWLRGEGGGGEFVFNVQSTMTVISHRELVYNALSTMTVGGRGGGREGGGERKLKFVKCAGGQKFLSRKADSFRAQDVFIRCRRVLRRHARWRDVVSCLGSLSLQCSCPPMSLGFRKCMTFFGGNLCRYRCLRSVNAPPPPHPHHKKQFPPETHPRMTLGYHNGRYRP